MLNPHRHPSQQQSIKLSMLLVLTLAKFASLTQSEGTMEGYEKLLYGSLDVLAAEGGPRGVRSLFAELWHEKRSSQLAAFGLLVAEQLIHLVDAATIRDKVMPLAAKYFVRPEHRTAFEASHAFVLVLLDVASNTLDKDSTQAHFVEAMVKICAQGLLKDARHGSVTSAQLLPAFTAVVRAAARYDTVLVAYCVEQLDSADFDSQEYVTAVNMIRISIIPSIPQPDMAKYLDSVATVILAAPQGSEARLELAAHAFKVIMNDIPDETRQEGLDWWLKYRRVFQSQKEMRARL
jgi:hypothetical protein